MKPLKLLLTLSCAVACIGLSGVARACAVCATADTTLGSSEGEYAFRGRIQATLDVREGWVSAANLHVDDTRAELGFHYAPWESWLFTADAPLLFRRVNGAGVPQSERIKPGDAALRVDHVQATWGHDGQRQRLSVFVELKLPTSPLEQDHGVFLPSALQPGCGALVPAVGAVYAIGGRRWSFDAALSFWLPFAVREDYHGGASIRLSAREQWQPFRTLAFRFGTNVELDGAGKLAAGRSDPDSGGVVVYAAGEIATRPIQDLSLTVGAAYPALTALSGNHSEGPIASLTASYDF